MLSFYTDPMAFHCRLLTQLCYGMFQSDSQDRGWKACSWPSHFHLQRSAAYPYVQYRNNVNVTQHIFTIQFLMENVCKREQSGSRLFPFIPARLLVLTFPPSADLSSSLSLLLRLCCLILQKLIKRSTFYTASLLVRAVIILAAYFSSWLIVFSSLPCYIWFTGTCKSTGIDWVRFLNNAFDCL